ncbi:MAG: hypothetical protein CO137_01270, partial [Candidatus Magasanikbacteria bacterium CG_4_9_14_3_um_filter_32_9]
KSISSTKNEIAELREKKRQIEIKILTKEAEALFSNNELEESILKYQSLIRIDFQNAQIYNDKIASMYSTIADKKFSNNDYESAISYYNKALLFNQQKKYEVKKAETYQKIAENEMNLEKYSEAISNFDQVITLMPEKEEIINPLLANAYFKLGKNDYTSDQKITAVNKFKKSYSLDVSLKNEIEPFLSSMRRTPLLYGFYSIIPGLGQLLQGKNSRGITQFSLFSASIVGGFIFKSSSKDTYSKYEKAVTSDDAQKLYEEANVNKRLSDIALGVSAGIIIWSVIDSFLEAENYNKPFYLSTSLVNYNVNIAEKSYQLSISFNF